MVEKRLNLEPEVQEIFKLIDEGKNFLLSGGAGSGKTYSLVSVIRQVIAENPMVKVACMTYTNVAVKEIEDRVNHKNLNVSTIHDFLWDNIKHFQKELKKIMIDLINDNESKISILGLSSVPDDYFDRLENGIQYKEYTNIKEGIISHDELIIIADKMFEKYHRLCKIVKDKYKFIFIDEYQDTNKKVVNIFLNHFGKEENGKSIIGFFGDAMQSIYDDGIGNLDEYKGTEVVEIQKTQNRRNPKFIIELANKLRTDGITQVPSTDQNAPNMEGGIVKEGRILFLYSNKNKNLESVRNYLIENEGWDFNKVEEIKELNLTHNLIAEEANFKTLMDIYNKEPIIGLKDDMLKKNSDNKESNKPEIEITDEDTFDIVVDKFQLKNKQKELKKDIILSNPITAELYNQLKDKLFSEVRKIILNKDQLLDDKRRDNLINHLYKIQNVIYLYQNKRYNEFIRATDNYFKIKTISDKQNLESKIESLINVGDKTIEDIITEADEMGICKIDDHLEKFKSEKEYVYNRVKEVPFQEFQEVYDYLEEKTPFSTQHKTKGREYDNVLVILDNGGWNKYNFEKMFLNTAPNSVMERTQKIFYVCCTRAKENLAVFFHNPNQDVINKAKEWFGEDNVIEV